VLQHVSALRKAISFFTPMQFSAGAGAGFGRRRQLGSVWGGVAPRALALLYKLQVSANPFAVVGSKKGRLQSGWCENKLSDK
jgi:hypothetical protein